MVLQFLGHSDEQLMEKLQTYSFPTHQTKAPARSARDDRTYRRLCRAGLAFDNVLTYVQIPVLNGDNEVEYQPWPILQPHHRASQLEFLNTVRFMFC